MSLDSAEDPIYTGSDIEKRASTSGDSAREGDQMIVFLSFPSRDHCYQNVVRTLRGRGLTVLTNLDSSSVENPERKSEMRLRSIRQSDAFVYFAPYANHRSSVRQIEFGYALGRGIPVAFVGKPFNSLHRFGDVFVDVDEFLAEWYSPEYLERISQWFADRESSTQVA